MRQRSLKIITVHALLMLLVSCMPAHRAGIEELGESQRQSRQFVVRGDFKSALDLYSDLCRRYSADPGVIASYVKTREDIERAANDAFSREDFALSGRAYHALLNSAASCRDLLDDPLLEKRYRQRLQDSSVHLSQRALREYRRGNLAEAISVWEAILAFDPNNAEIAKAVEKARIQRKNLQQQ